MNDTDTAECTHKHVPIPEFDFDKVIRHKMSVHDIRRTYPRTEEKCPDCGKIIIIYKSFEHYIAGDW